jgi:RNA polymerase sigma-70 factor (ECF subfamily)
MNLENKTDEELILLAQQNGCKDEVFTKLYNKYQEMVLNYATSFCKNRTLAKDFSQETFLRVYLNFEDYIKLPNAKFKNWVYTITTNLLLDDYRRKNVLNNSEDISETSKYTNFSETRDPEKELIAKERLEKINDEINSLGEISKDVIDLIKEEFKYKEVAENLGISREAVAGRLLRSRKLLIEKLGKDFFYQ